MTRSAEIRSEILLIAVLLAVDILFYVVVIPYGIADPEGFGLDEGLPPSFSAKVAAGLLALVMIVRLITLWFRPQAAQAAGAVLADDGEDGGEPVRVSLPNLIGIAAALVFAYLAVPVLGFYLSGFLLLAGLMRVMGETRWLVLLWQPATVVFLIWGLFDRIFSINLPAGVLFGG
ncbi:MAG: tripartite tricarboxylate transporter TctB family protein [Thalassobaculaceae bacterium]|nr:tripartite tricarboxylate transporter TctB family protein [Thalassobaculaceae bacterium]